MKGLTNLMTVILTMIFISCQTPPDKSHTDTMDKARIKTEVIQAETDLLTALRQGELMKGVSVHLNSPDYRNIWNGEIKTYEMLETRIKRGIENGLKSIDYHVQSRDFNFISPENVLETLTATETTTMADKVLQLLVRPQLQFCGNILTTNGVLDIYTLRNYPTRSERIQTIG